jgi:hypothetical protein
LAAGNTRIRTAVKPFKQCADAASADTDKNTLSIIAQKTTLVKHFQKILILFLLFPNKSINFAA